MDLTVNDIKKMCLSLGFTICDYPFREDRNNCVARHTENKKWFALFYIKDGLLYINLKCDPIRALMYKDEFSSVTSAYHMNKKHWISVCIGGDVTKEILSSMILDSYNLTKGKMPAHFTYVLKCADNSLYCGYTNNVEARVKTHNSGKGAKYTKARLPVELVHCEGFYDKSEALRREIEIKKLTRAEKLELIGDFLDNISAEK